MNTSSGNLDVHLHHLSIPRYTTEQSSMDDQLGKHSKGGGGDEVGLNPSEEALQYLSTAFHRGEFSDIQPAIEAFTGYHDLSTTLFIFIHRLQRITGPLTQSLLHTHVTTPFTPWVLKRIQASIETMTETYQENVDILLPLVSYETNRYGSTLLDRFLTVVPGTLWLNSSYAVWTANRAWEAPDEMLSLAQKRQIVESVVNGLGANGLRDERFGEGLKYSYRVVAMASSPMSPARPSSSQSQSHAQSQSQFQSQQQDPQGLSPEEREWEREQEDPKPTPIPLLHGSALAELSTHLFTLNLHNTFRGILWRLDITLPLHPFADFLRIHLPLLHDLLPILPSHNIPYTDFVLGHFCQNMLYALLHQCVGMEPVEEDGREWREWEERRVLAEEALRGLDQGALRAVLGAQYEGTVGMKGIRRSGLERKEADAVMRSVEGSGV
ncbi:hypothetical protein CC80DRAFT_179838 [Byssothecium circinans]|uniref:Uncharacterized protein n=1 Tax=Byssothecium circinans TaxID=147558 RepID=A0A6A5TJS0_9PLEO|nr:hypothetical protein CC80DRAFT_179838 [Byssothecium circinans]